MTAVNILGESNISNEDSGTTRTLYTDPPPTKPFTTKPYITVSFEFGINLLIFSALILISHKKRNK